MLKKTALIAALALTPAFGTAVVVADSPAVEEDLATATGMVTAFDKEATQFTLEITPLEIVDVDWNDDTAFTLDGETSTADDVLIQGRLVTVEHTDGLAVNVHGLSEDAPE